MVDRIAAALGNLAGPSRCPWCRRPHSGPCRGCVVDLPWNGPACSRCATPLPQGLTNADACVDCRRDPPPQDSSWAAFRYAEPVARRVLGMKFAADLGAAAVLGDALATALKQRPDRLPEMLVPVPLHPSRLRQRGYNQSLELARVVGRHLRVRVAFTAAERVRATEEQTHLGAAARRRNLHGAFRVSPEVAGRHVALIDDVITTGATAAELASAMRLAGAARIEVWAVARTP